MTGQLTRDDAFRVFARGKPVAVIPHSDLGKALRISGSFPTEAYINSLPSNAGELSVFRSLEEPPLPISFEDALTVLLRDPDGEIRNEDLAYALQGCGEPLPADQTDEILSLASKGMDIACLIKTIHEWYSPINIK